MDRTGLLIALAVAVAAGLLFGLYPQLDLIISRLFFEHFGSSFPKPSEGMEVIRNLYSLVIAALVAPALLAVVIKLLRPRGPMLIPSRAVIFLVSTIVLAPGLMTNVLLKDHWGRARPYAIREFGGAEQFTAWWDPRGTCDGNCSFVAGEPSGAFWTFAPAAVLVPAPYRAAAYGAAVAFGTAVGVLRIAHGAHFASDVIFAGVFVFLVIWIVHGLLYRWRARAVSDRKIENDLARAGLWLRTFFQRERRQKKRPAGGSRAGRNRTKQV